MRHLRFVGQLLFVTASLWVAPANCDELDDKLAKELRFTIMAFQLKHGLSEDDIDRIIGKVLLPQAFSRKGGVGIIEKDLYVVLDDERNKLLLDGKTWIGADSSISEVVLTDGHQVYCSASGLDLEELQIVMFLPEEATFTNYATKRGGKYRRFVKTPTP